MLSFDIHSTSLVTCKMKVTIVCTSYFKNASNKFFCYTDQMSKQTKKSVEIEFLKRSQCPVTNTLEIVGDKWTMVIIRDLFFGKKTYGDFQDSLERIPTNILSDRLKRLESSGIVERTPYQDKPVRYEYSLTDKGKDLRKVLKALKEWGLKYIPGTNAAHADKLLKKQ